MIRKCEERRREVAFNRAVRSGESVVEVEHICIVVIGVVGAELGGC
jgi:hypothetical protein